MNARPLLPGLLLLREARLATLFMLSLGVRARPIPIVAASPDISEGIVACAVWDTIVVRDLHISGQCRRR